MSRDYRKLRMFQLADRLVLDVYRASARFPIEERYGLQSNFRRAAVSAAVNIVEGSARIHQNEYVNFLDIANSSSAEAGYLSSVSGRLSFLAQDAAESLEQEYGELCAGLTNLIRSYRNR